MVYECPLLTNYCVIDGISQYKTLQIIRITRCKNMTEKCLAFIECETIFLSCGYKETVKKQRNVNRGNKHSLRNITNKSSCCCS